MMDGHRFERFVQALQRGLSRREVVAGLGNLLVGSVLLPGDTTAKKRKKKCAHAGQTTNKKRRRCCKGLVKGLAGHCTQAGCDVCASGCAFTSVQAAVNAANPGNAIAICAGSYPGNVSIPFGKDLILIGAGDGDNPAVDTILDATGSDDSVVDIQSAAVALQGLRLTGGSDSLIGGGGMHNDGGSVTMTDCTVSASEGWFGGGIYTSGGSLTMTNCSVTGNTGEYGGGLHVDSGMVVLDACAVTGNAAALGGAGHLEGGGIYVKAGTLTMTGCTLAGNEADYGGGMWVNIGTVTLDASAVTGNSAARFGGGLVNGGTVNLVNGSSITGNEAGDPPPSGGGIMNQGTVDASGGSITGNTPDNCINGLGGTGCA